MRLNKTIHYSLLIISLSIFTVPTQMSLFAAGSNQTSNTGKRVVNRAPKPQGAKPSKKVAKPLSNVGQVQKDAKGIREVSTSSEADASSTNSSKMAFEQLVLDSNVHPVVRYRNAFPRSVKMSVDAAGITPAEKAREFLRKHKNFYQQNDPDNELILSRQNSGVMEYVYFSQEYNGIPVYGAELLVGISGNDVKVTLGELIPQSDLAGQGFSIQPTISAQQAEVVTQLALNTPQDAPTLSDSELTILDRSLVLDAPSEPRLVWKVIMAAAGNTWESFVDAHTEEVLLTLGLDQHGGGSLHDFDFDLQDAENEANASDDACYWGSDDVDIATESWFNSDYNNDPDATGANNHARNAYAFFHDNFNLHSYDNDGYQVEVFVHATVDNASYSPGCDLIQFNTGWVDFEVMVHEFTHGIIHFNNDLNYSFQSGALNESYADTMAVVADRERGDMNWTIAEDRTGFTSSIRNFQNPARDRFSQYDPGTPTLFMGFEIYPDNGLVHTNSGIANKAAYLMAQGDTFNGVLVPGMGLSKMRDLKYKAMRWIPKNSKFADARDFEVGLAQEWADNGIKGFTNLDVCTVRNAWAAVEVGTACNQSDDPTGIDGDFISISDGDNCPDVYNPDQSDIDNDNVGDVCDNCIFQYNPNQLDTDDDDEGDVCDDDDDGDGCDDDVDDDPLNEWQVVGKYICVDCPGEGGSIEEPASNDTDGDGVLNCEDDDDDDDGILDQADSCPAGPLTESTNLPNGLGGECTVFDTCNCPLMEFDPIGCKLGDCFEIMNEYDHVVNPDPTTTGGVSEMINIMNESILMQ